jgi:hypothetical protein
MRQSRTERRGREGAGKGKGGNQRPQMQRGRMQRHAAKGDRKASQRRAVEMRGPPTLPAPELARRRVPSCSAESGRGAQWAAQVTARRQGDKTDSGGHMLQSIWSGVNWLWVWRHAGLALGAAQLLLPPGWRRGPRGVGKGWRKAIKGRRPAQQGSNGRRFNIGTLRVHSASWNAIRLSSQIGAQRGRSLPGSRPHSISAATSAASTSAGAAHAARPVLLTAAVRRRTVSGAPPATPPPGAPRGTPFLGPGPPVGISRASAKPEAAAPPAGASASGTYGFEDSTPSPAGNPAVSPLALALAMTVGMRLMPGGSAADPAGAAPAAAAAAAAAATAAAAALGGGGPRGRSWPSPGAGRRLTVVAPAVTAAASAAVGRTPRGVGAVAGAPAGVGRAPVGVLAAALDAPGAALAGGEGFAGPCAGALGGGLPLAGADAGLGFMDFWGRLGPASSPRYSTIIGGPSS